jgi:hypothetical protein
LPISLSAPRRRFYGRADQRRTVAGDDSLYYFESIRRDLIGIAW